MLRARALLVTAVLTSTAAVAACSPGGSERVGGQPATPTRILTMLDVFDRGEVTPFVDEVSRLSGGRLQIRILSATYDGAGYEASAIRDVQSGRADLGVAGTRAWDAFGVLALRALGAPFLVDSYPLQQRVLTSDLGDTMLDQLRPAGVVGVGILPGPIRRPFGAASTLAAPDDFRGMVIGTQESTVADATMRALGARPQRLPLDAMPDPGSTPVDGLELQVSALESNGLDAVGSHLMTNVDLWPRSIVVFAAPHAYRSLTDEQQRILSTAARDAAAGEAAEARSRELESAANLCRKGHSAFDAASPGQLRALRRAVQPVYAQLERDPGTRAAIAAILQLKKRLGEPPSVVPLCTPMVDQATSGARTAIDGVWTMQTDRAAAAPEYYDENWGHWVFVFDRGRFAITQENKTSCTWGYGTYAVNGARTSWTFTDGGGIAPNGATNRPGEFFVFDVSSYRDTLALSPVEGEISPLNFRARPWRRVSETASSDQLSKRCSPPAAALPH